METEQIVYFYRQTKAAGREYPWQKAVFPIQETFWNERRIAAVGIPEYDYGKRCWKPSKLKKKMLSELVPLLKDKTEKTAFLCHKSLNMQRDIMESLFPLELSGEARPTPLDMTETIIREFCRFDALVVLAGEGFDLDEFVLAHCGRVNYLAVVTETPAGLEEVFEDISEEYGLTGITVRSLKELHVPVKYHVLAVDAAREERKAWRYLPSGCTYLDLFSMESRRRNMETRRKDIRYLSFSRQVEKKIHILGL